MLKRVILTTTESSTTDKRTDNLSDLSFSMKNKKSKQIQCGGQIETLKVKITFPL